MGIVVVLPAPTKEWAEIEGEKRSREEKEQREKLPKDEKRIDREL